MALGLFPRRFVASDPVTWTPEGTIVTQRYRALEGATVVVYTADADRSTLYYAVACLACPYRADHVNASTPMSEQDAAYAANSHAANCRAITQGVPSRPADTDAAGLVRSHLRSRRRTHEPSPRTVRISEFNVIRVDLQRSTDWIKAQMMTLAQMEPDFLTAEPEYRGTGTRFLIQPHPRRS
ncbi:hypothetical protein AB0I82_35355 [Streptomyces sp. NPDC050315]|uniref:hypothetical protein n=1 Tax=Streptomyces sp. NPDC050315 TaxID=3155039 RepID=UPI003446001B